MAVLLVCDCPVVLVLAPGCAVVLPLGTWLCCRFASWYVAVLSFCLLVRGGTAVLHHTYMCRRYPLYLVMLQFMCGCAAILLLARSSAVTLFFG